MNKDVEYGLGFLLQEEFEKEVSCVSWLSYSDEYLKSIADASVEITWEDIEKQECIWEEDFSRADNEVIKGYFKGIPFEIKVIMNEYITLHICDCDKQRFNSLVSFINKKIMDGNLVCCLNTVDGKEEQNYENAIIVWADNPVTIMRDILSGNGSFLEENEKIQRIEMLNGKRLDFYRDNVRQSLITDFGRV